MSPVRLPRSGFAPATAGLGWAFAAVQVLRSSKFLVNDYVRAVQQVRAYMSAEWLEPLAELVRDVNMNPSHATSTLQLVLGHFAEVAAHPALLLGEILSRLQSIDLAETDGRQQSPLWSLLKRVMTFDHVCVWTCKSCKGLRTERRQGVPYVMVRLNVLGPKPASVKIQTLLGRLPHDEADLTCASCSSTTRHIVARTFTSELGRRSSGNVVAGLDWEGDPDVTVSGAG